MAASPPSSDAAARDRIVAHMNASHSREMSRYLQHFLRLPESATPGAIMTDISTSEMRIKAGGRVFAVPFSPPLASLAEVRPRVVAMDAEARAALGISDIVLDVYLPPHGFECVTGLAVVFYFVTFLTLPLVRPGTAVWAMWDAVFPGGIEWYMWVVKAIFVPVLGIHLTEAWWMHEKRMKRHSVEPGSGLWWKWEVSVFFEGVAAWKRLDRLLERKKRELEAKKH